MQLSWNKKTRQEGTDDDDNDGQDILVYRTTGWKANSTQKRSTRQLAWIPMQRQVVLSVVQRCHTSSFVQQKSEFCFYYYFFIHFIWLRCVVASLQWTKMRSLACVWVCECVFSFRDCLLIGKEKLLYELQMATRCIRRPLPHYRHTDGTWRREIPQKEFSLSTGEWIW